MPPEIVDLNDWQVEDWPSTPEGEARQAKEIEEMYRILFSHPLVQAITTWDYKDGAWLKAPSGYIRLDNSLKPSYKMLKNLVRNEWWTDTEVMTDAEGYANVEAFKGEYSISCNGASANTELNNNNSLILVLK